MYTRMQWMYWPLEMSLLLGTRVAPRSKPYVASTDRSRTTMKIRQKRKTQSRIASDSKRRNKV